MKRKTVDIKWREKTKRKTVDMIVDEKWLKTKIGEKLSKRLFVGNKKWLDEDIHGTNWRNEEVTLWIGKWR